MRMELQDKQIELGGIEGVETVYAVNMRAMWNSSLKMAQAVDLVDEMDFVPLEQTRSGTWTCQRVGAKGEPVYLHSRYDPEKEGQKWAEGALALGREQEDRELGRVPMCFFVDGFGLGYHVKALFDKLLGDAFIVVSEPDLGLIRSALGVLDYSEMLESGRVIFVTSTDRDEIFRKLEPHATKITMGLVFTRPLQKVNAEFHQVIHQMVGEYASYLRSNYLTVLGNSVKTCENILHNLPTYVGTPSIDILNNRFGGCPVVVVSAGPSLKKNLGILREIRERVVLVAVQTTLKPLLAAGIRPDFVTSLDYHEVGKGFYEGLEDLSDIHLVAEPKTHWSVVDYYRKRGPVSLLGNEFAALAFWENEDGHGHLTAGSTVAHLAYYLARYLGGDPIIFVGQDLGYTNNVYYSPGTRLHSLWRPELNRFCTMEMKEWERIVRSRGILRKVKDAEGNDIYTDEQMFTYLQKFEAEFSECPARVIDATGGGVKKQFCETMSLAEAAEQFCDKRIDPKLFEYRRQMKWFDGSKLEEVRELLEKRIVEVQELYDIGEETLVLVKAMLELIGEQDKLNQKMVRLDELRGMVTQRKEIYRMTGFVAQGAEMYRFRQDKTLKLDNLEGEEKQRRQLTRDVGYVSEINKGCQRLKGMLEECLGRFDEEIEKL